MSKTVRRVETLYSYKLPDGSLLPRGVYTVDSPKGIPDVVVKDALSGRTTVRVLEWGGEAVVKKITPASEPEEVVTTLDVEDDVVETSDEEEKPKKTSDEEEKPKKTSRKRK